MTLPPPAPRASAPLQSPEHLHAGHAAPTHPLSRRPGVFEAAVRAVGGPERTQPAAAAAVAAARQGPLQPGRPAAAATGPIQFSGEPRIQNRSTTRPEPHVSVAFGSLVAARFDRQV